MNRELLEKPFTADQIKQRKGGEGKMLDYIEGAAVVQRLNEAFEGAWTFEVQDEKILENEVIVRGSLSAGGQTKMQFGSKDITRAKADGSIISLGDDLKAATTDALKKCATQFGVGLHLYFEEKTVATPPQTAVRRVELNGVAPSNGNGQSDGRITAAQLSKVFYAAKDLQWSQTETRDFAKQMFGKLPDFLSKREASALIDHLIHLKQNGGRA